MKDNHCYIEVSPALRLRLFDFLGNTFDMGRKWGLGNIRNGFEDIPQHIAERLTEFQKAG